MVSAQNILIWHQ